MMLLPPAPGACPICATVHFSCDPHNAESLYYQYRFLEAHGRWPTWGDAVAHCDPDLRELWKKALIDAGGTWTKPDGAEPIADPSAESFRQAVGACRAGRSGRRSTNRKNHVFPDIPGMGRAGKISRR